MPYKIEFNDSAYMTAATLGDLVSASSSVEKIKVITDYIFWAEGDGYWFSQATAASRFRSLGVYRQNSMIYIYLGGQLTTIGDVSTVFGASTIDGRLEVEFDLVALTYSLNYENSVIKTGSVDVGTGAISNTLFRLAGRADDSTSGSTGGAWLLRQDEQIGDTRVYLDTGSGYVLERNYVIPSTGTTIPDNENAQDGTMRGTFSDSQLVFYAPPAVTPVNPSITSLLATSARLNWEQG